MPSQMLSRLKAKDNDNEQGGPVAAVQSLSRARLFVTPGTAAQPASLSFTISQSWLRLKSTESVERQKSYGEE